MMQDNAYENKYLKYKKKYLDLKHGGRLCRFAIGDVVKGPEGLGFGIVRQVDGNKVWADFAGINGDMKSFHRKKDTQFNKTNEKTPQEVANQFGNWYWQDEDYSQNIKRMFGLKKPSKNTPSTPQKQSSAKMTAPGAPIKQAAKAETCEFKVGDVVKSSRGFGIVREILGDQVWADWSGINGDKWSWHCNSNKSVNKTNEKTAQEVANMFGNWYWNAGDYNKNFIKSIGLKNPNSQCEFQVGDVVESRGKYGFGIVTQITGTEVWADWSGINGDKHSWDCINNKSIVKTKQKTAQQVANMFGNWYWEVGDYNKEIREKLGLKKQ
jgi:hypothetical protein